MRTDYLDAAWKIATQTEMTLEKMAADKQRTAQLIRDADEQDDLRSEAAVLRGLAIQQREIMKKLALEQQLRSNAVAAA